MQVVIVGLNHNSANLSVRERLAFPTEDIPPALARLRDTVGEGFILSTCNRVEVYALAGHGDSGAAAIRKFLFEERGLSVEELATYTYSFTHEDAVRHLFRVAGGVDSMLVGENEILGQLRRALAVAHENGALGPTLGRLGAAALRGGRAARGRTGLGSGPVSLVSLGIRAAIGRGAIVSHSKVLVLGSGDIANTVLRQLRQAGAAGITLVNRSEDRGAKLSTAHGVASGKWESRKALVAEADIVIGCTSAPEPVLSAADIGPREKRPLICIDLGVPRDIDAAARDLPGVQIIDMDELEAFANEVRAKNTAAAEQAELLLASSAEKFMEWWRSRQVVPTIIDLRAYAEQIRDEEFRRAASRLPGLSQQQLSAIQAMAQRIIGKLLHRPLTMVKHDAEGANMAQVLRYLFQLDGAPAAGEGPLGTSQNAQNPESVTEQSASQ